MATYTRAICLPQFRSVLSTYGSKQFQQFSGKVRLTQCRLFASRGLSDRRTVLQSSFLYYGLAGVVAGAGYSYYELKFKDRSPVANETEFKPIIINKLPDFEPARKIRIPTDNTGLKLVLYQYPTCPFCCKVRAFLDYYGLSYDVVEVDPVLRQQMKWSEYKKVPILLAQLEDGTYLQLNDSSMITSVIKTYLIDQKQSLLDIASCYPVLSYKDEDGVIKQELQNRYFLMTQNDTGRSKEAIIDEVKWRKWADNKLVHVLSPNVYRTKDEAIQSFEWFSEVGEWDRLFPKWERDLIVYVGAYAMWMIGKRLKKRHMLKDDVRQSLYDELNTWTRNLKQKGSPFNGGSKPNLSDLAVYGVLSSIEGCQAFEDALEKTMIGDWYNKMREHVSSHTGSNAMTGR